MASAPASLVYKRYVLAVLLGAYAFTFLDRQVLSVALESIKAELVLTDTELGVLTGLAFAIFYSLSGIPIARWADRGNRPLIIALSLGLLSVTVALCSVVGNFLQLMTVRVGVGIGEAGVVPPAHSLVATYFERPERLRAMSILLLGGPLSLAVGYLLGGWANEFLGWRTAFLIIAIPGCILTVLVRTTIREPRQALNLANQPAHAPVSLIANAQAQSRAAQPVASASMRQVLAVLWGQPTFRHLLLAFSVLYLFGFGLVQWMPVFFIRIHHMSTGELGTWMAIIWGLGNAIGTYAGGRLTGRTPDAERRQLRIVSLVAGVYVPINIVVLLAPEKHVALTFMFIGAVVNALASAPLFALIQTLAPERMRATAVAGVFLISNLIGLGLGPLVVGVLSDGLAPKFGVNALRIALLACTPGYWWVAAHLFKASRTVMSDLMVIEERETKLAAAPGHAA